MAKKDKITQKTAQEYVDELKEMIQSRTQKPMEAWLYPQVRATALNMVILDKIQDELLKKNSFVTIVDGSTGYKKNEVNPLLSHYDKAQRTLMSQLEALGLNYSTNMKKLGDPKDTTDPLETVLNEIKQ